MENNDFILGIKIEGEIFHLYRITIKGQTVLAASLSLNKRIEELIL